MNNIIYQKKLGGNEGEGNSNVTVMERGWNLEDNQGNEKIEYKEENGTVKFINLKNFSFNNDR